MKIDFNVCGQRDIREGVVVFTIYNKYYLVTEILDDTKFWGFEFPDYRKEGAFLEIDDVLEVIELPKNVVPMIFKKMEKIKDDHFDKILRGEME